MVTTTRAFVTAEELIELPDDVRVELIDGELIDLAPSPGSPHGRIQMRIGRALLEYCERTGAGEAFTGTGFVLGRNPDTVLRPDVSFVRAERSVNETGCIEGAPDLAVEVLSPRKSLLEIRLKVTCYLEARSTLVWVVDPVRRTLGAYARGTEPVVLSEKAIVTAEELLPGFSHQVSKFLH